LFSVGLRPTGLLFDEANTESTASLWGVETRRETGASTAKYTPVGHLRLPIWAFVKRAALYPTTEVVGFSASTQYNCLLFEGPGQGGALYEKRLFFRPDYETVVDVASHRADVDTDRLALVGRSFGGYLAPRAATTEHRLAALVADPGIYDLGGLVVRLVPEELLAPVLEGDPDADAVLDEQLKDPHALEYFGSRMAAHGLNSLGEYVRELQKYTYETQVNSIHCPTLITDNESDRLAIQSHDLVSLLTAPTQYTKFTDMVGAGGHCEGMGQSVFHQRIFDWLDETLDRSNSV
jgi:pimeloyl-ACP methyl ester carboxylesterase